MREYRVIDAWRPRGKDAANGSILSGSTVGENVDFMLTPVSKDVDFSQKQAKCSFHAARKLKNADFRPKEVKMLISC